ncbi:MAG: toll/interleukin-1 receptor domain-containing protein [Candidatus Hodarchaeales archaeon]|jgi:hypothetical protein
MINNHLVFLSYATEDKKLAFKTVNALEKENIKCWIAPRDVSGGELFVDSIMEAIFQCELLIVLISKYSNISRFVRREVGTAFENDKILMPIRVENIEPAKKLNFYLGDHHWLDIWDKPIDFYLIEIVQEVRNKFSRIKSKAGPDPYPDPKPFSFPFGVFEIKVADEKKSEIMSFIQFLIMKKDLFYPPIRKEISPIKWRLDFEEFIKSYLKSDSIKKWLSARFELMLNNPRSLQNLVLVDALYMLPPLRTEFDHVYDNLINFGRAAIIGPKFSGKKRFILYLAFHWSILEYEKIWFIDDPNLISRDEWITIENNFTIMTADSSNKKKILFVIFDSNVLNPVIDSNVRRIVNLASNTNLSILFVSERETVSDSDISYYQDLLRLPKLSDIVEINKDRNWKLLYKEWINSMLKLIFNINIDVITNQISEVESIKELQEEIDVLKVINMNNQFKHGKYPRIIDQIERNEKNIVLHQILIDSLLQNYNSDLTIEVLDEKKKFYKDHDNLGMWYYYYGKALILKGESKNATNKFNHAMKYLNSVTQNDIKDEIREWTGDQS